MVPPAQKLWHKTGNADGNAGKADGTVCIHDGSGFSSQVTDYAARFGEGRPIFGPQGELGINAAHAAHLVEGEGTDGLMAPAERLPEAGGMGFDAVRVKSKLGAVGSAVANVIEVDGAAGAGGIL